MIWSLYEYVVVGDVCFEFVGYFEIVFYECEFVVFGVGVVCEYGYCDFVVWLYYDGVFDCIGWLVDLFGGGDVDVDCGDVFFVELVVYVVFEYVDVVCIVCGFVCEVVWFYGDVFF